MAQAACAPLAIRARGLARAKSAAPNHGVGSRRRLGSNVSASSNALLETALRQQPALLALGRSLVGSAGEDLVQDALLAAVRHPRPVTNPLAWCRRVLKNRAVSRHRTATRRQDREERCGAPDDPESLESLAARTQILDALVEEWAKLEAPYAETLRLRFEEGLTAREIGERLDCPTNTASWRLREGVSRLRARLDERFGDRRHWLGALVAVPGVTSGVPKAAATTTHPMKTISALLLAATAVTVTAVAANASEPQNDRSDGADGVGAAAVSSNATVPNAHRQGSTAMGSPAMGRGKATEDDMASAESRAPFGDLPVGYGVMIETAGTGMEACGEEIGDLASIGRDVYAGCAEDAGFDPQSEFSMAVSFASLDGEQTRAVQEGGSEQGGSALASCLEAQLFDAEMELSGFSGTLTFMFRSLRPDEESPQAIAARASALPAEVFPELDIAWRGPADAPMTVLECIDPDCPFTRRAAASLDRLLDEHDGRVRVAQLQQPLAMHAGARRKSRALVAAANHDGYWAAADYLHTHPGPFDNEDFGALAAELDLDAATFLQEIDSADTEAALVAQEEACAVAGSRGTPTFFVEGHRMPGAVPYEALDALVDQQQP